MTTDLNDLISRKKSDLSLENLPCQKNIETFVCE